ASQTVLVESPAGAFSQTQLLSDTSVTLSAPGALPSDVAPLLVRAEIFTVKAISQQTPNPGEANTLTVTLASNVALAAATKITLTGLTGSMRTSTNSLLIVDVGGTGAAAIFGGAGVWFRNAGTLTLQVAVGQEFTANTAYVFSFSLVNPATSQAARSVSVSATGSAVSIASAPMSVDPLCLPARGATALASSVALPDATVLYVQNAARAGITSRRHVRIWDEIMLITSIANAAGAGITSGRHVRIEDEIMLITYVTGDSMSGATVHTIVIGSGDGDCQPLRVHAPAFVVAEMVQSIHWVDADNTLTLYLASNAALRQSGGAVVTITGLTDTQTTDTPLLNLTDADTSGAGGGALFGGAGVWTQRSGTLVLTLASNVTLLPDEPYAFSFQVKNYNPATLSKSPGLAKISPALFISARGSVAIPLTQVSSDETLAPCVSSTNVSDAGGVSASATTFSVHDASGVHAGGHLDISGEVLEVTSVAASVVTVKRGQRGSAATEHLSGAPVCIIAGGAVAGYAQPLVTYKHGLVVAVIGQSSPFLGATNTLSVT
ncbi:hypothetical protein T484DRAFT_1800974, partial [Baffinella frigidus]